MHWIHIRNIKLIWVKKLEKGGQIKSKVNIRKEIIKIRAEINETENKKSTEKIKKKNKAGPLKRSIKS